MKNTGDLRQISDTLRLMQDKQSVMDEKLDAISKDLNHPKTGLGRLNERMDAVWDQVEKITLTTEEVKETLVRMETRMERITDNTRKLDKRVKTTEAELGIAPPAELSLYE